MVARRYEKRSRGLGRRNDGTSCTPTRPSPIRGRTRCVARWVRDARGTGIRVPRQDVAMQPLGPRPRTLGVRLSGEGQRTSHRDGVPSTKRTRADAKVARRPRRQGRHGRRSSDDDDERRRGGALHRARLLHPSHPDRGVARLLSPCRRVASAMVPQRPRVVPGPPARERTRGPGPRRCRRHERALGGGSDVR